MYARRFLASLQLALGQLNAAAAQIDQANRMAQTQLRLEPSNTDWRQAAAKSMQIRADILQWQDQPQQALVELQRAQPLVAGLFKLDPKVWAWRVELPEAQAQIESDLLRRLGRPNAALQIAQESVRRLQIVSQDPSQRAKAERWLVPSLGRVARLSSETGDAVAARVAWQALRTIGARCPGLDADGVLWLARANAQAGNVDESKRLLQRLEAASYRHPDFHESEPLSALAGGNKR